MVVTRLDSPRLDAPGKHKVSHWMHTCIHNTGVP